MNIFFKTIGIILIAATVIVCLLAFFPGLFGCYTANVVSGSMEPEIPVGSLIIAAPDDYEKLQKGDIVVYSSALSEVTHRVVSNDTIVREVITKGDANAQEDMNPVPYYQIIGKVRFHIPLAGNILQFLSTLWGKLCALGIVALGLVLIIVGSRKKTS